MGRKRHTAGADHHCTAGGRGGSGPAGKSVKLISRELGITEQTY